MGDAPLMDGPLRLALTFFRPRPKGHYGTGRNAGVLKDSAPDFPTTKPDGLKLARSVEDALTGVVYLDDALIVEGVQRKRYGPRYQVDVVVERVRPSDLFFEDERGTS